MVEVQRDDDYIDELESEVVFFNGEIEVMINACNSAKWI